MVAYRHQSGSCLTTPVSLNKRRAKIRIIYFIKNNKSAAVGFEISPQIPLLQIDVLDLHSDGFAHMESIPSIATLDMQSAICHDSL